ncbi:MAG: sigma 54-interacting transcriptional regulator [Sandaracinaceae bacterium]
MDRTMNHDRRGPPLKRLRVTIVEGLDAGRSFEPSGATLSIGTGPDNDAVLTDPTVSRYHLELTRAGDGIRVIDLGSSNGTYVGHTRIERAVVSPGARVDLGRTVLQLSDGAPRTEQATQRVEVAGVVARSEAMQRALSTAVQLAKSEVPVLLQGETGTGKEVLARAVHERSARKDGPFVVVDCGALPATLVASELFGHERGAFTGADRRRIGAFERAHGGTLFLDEIGELPSSVQPALLGVLERKRFRRVGGDVTVESDARVISATHRDLRPEANAGAFRPDLYFRLAVGRVRIPALRDRPDDIDALVEHFAREMTGTGDEVFGPAALDALRRQRWTGNVRELRNVVEASLAMGRLALEATAPSPNPLHVVERASADSSPRLPYAEARAEATAQFEYTYLASLIDETEGNASEAARRARMDRAWLLKLLKRHGLR